jgi:hypothetical protein
VINWTPYLGDFGGTLKKPLGDTLLGNHGSIYVSQKTVVAWDLEKPKISMKHSLQS